MPCHVLYQGWTDDVHLCSVLVQVEDNIGPCPCLVSWLADIASSVSVWRVKTKKYSYCHKWRQFPLSCRQVGAYLWRSSSKWTAMQSRPTTFTILSVWKQALEPPVIGQIVPQECSINLLYKYYSSSWPLLSLMTRLPYYYKTWYYSVTYFIRLNANWNTPESTFEFKILIEIGEWWY